MIRSSVLTMRDAAARAAPNLDLDALISVQDSGRSAIAELRRLLGLLRRQEPVPAPGYTPTIARRAYVLDGVTALGLR